MDIRFTVRQKIAIGTVIISIFLFLFTSPIASIFSDLVTPPDKVEQLTIEQTANDIRFEWIDFDNDRDLKSYVIKIGDEEFIVKSRVRSIEIQNYNKDLVRDNTDQELGDEPVTEDFSINVEFRSRDIFGFNSGKIEFELTNLRPGSVGQSYNFVNEDSSSTILTIYVIPILMVLISTLVALWIFGIDMLKNVKSSILFLYTGLITYPVSLLALNISELGVVESRSLNLFQSAVILFIITVVSFLIIYYMYLTVNILYVSLSKAIPLEQAAKAAQFLFSLISTYFVMIFFFPRVESIPVRIFFVSFFIFMYSLTSIVLLKGITYTQAISRALAITLAICFALIIISMWPINYVYSILSIAVFFYILLSISLEIRQNLSRYVWIEYSVLMILIFSLLVINASWGVEGSLFAINF